MPIDTTGIAGLLVIRQTVHADHRGFFQQTYVQSELTAALGREPVFVQGNHARSAAGVLRGFHAEPWDKLARAVRGRAMTAVADLRPDSPTFGRAEVFELGDGTDRLGLFIARGLGHAYCVLGDEPMDYAYQVTAEWSPGVDKRAVAWDDPTLAVPWPLEDPVLSDEDRAAPTLHERHPDHALFTGATS